MSLLYLFSFRKINLLTVRSTAPFCEKEIMTKQDMLVNIALAITIGVLVHYHFYASAITLVAFVILQAITQFLCK